MEVISVFDPSTPDCVREVAAALADWDYDLPVPTDDSRCLGFILEQSIALFLREVLPQYEIELSGAIDYPNIHLWCEGGPSLAFEVKASSKTTGIGNRVKSPESIVSVYDQYDGHWVLAIFYQIAGDGSHLQELMICILPMWQYASTTFKDMSAISALSSLSMMLRDSSSGRAFRSEQDFLSFVEHMSGRGGTTAERNAMARQWLERNRSDAPDA